MRANSITSLRDEAVSKIAAAFPQVYCAPHPGNFTEKTIRQAAQRTPAILTSLPRCSASSTVNDTLEFVSWVIDRASASDKLYGRAAEITAALIALLREIDFDSLVIEKTEVDAECLFSGDLDAINVTLWAVRTRLSLAENIFNEASLSDLEVFEGYRALHEAGGASAQDEVTLQAIVSEEEE